MTFAFLVSDKPAVPALELGFAVSASSIDSDKTFKLMKDTIKATIDDYGIGRVRYGMIVFGDSASIKVNFRDAYEMNKLKTFIDVIVKEPSGAALDKALEKAKDMFTASGVRADARKVLVVITDKMSGRSPSNIRDAAKELKEEQVHIVAVSIGEESDEEELENTHPLEVISEKDKDADPEDVADAIMRVVLKGKQLYRKGNRCGFVVAE